MEPLPRYTLSYDHRQGDWTLRQNNTSRVVRRYETKGEATAGGVLKGAVGQAGGSVLIHKTNGSFDEERTFPRSKDPKESPG